MFDRAVWGCCAAVAAPWLERLKRYTPSDACRVESNAGRRRTLLRRTLCTLSNTLRRRTLTSLGGSQAREGSYTEYWTPSNDAPGSSAAPSNAALSNAAPSNACLSGDVFDRLSRSKSSSAAAATTRRGFAAPDGWTATRGGDGRTATRGGDGRRPCSGAVERCARRRTLTSLGGFRAREGSYAECWTPSYDAPGSSAVPSNTAPSNAAPSNACHSGYVLDRLSRGKSSSAAAATARIGFAAPDGWTTTCGEDGRRPGSGK